MVGNVRQLIITCCSPKGKNCAIPNMINKHTMYLSVHYAKRIIERNEQKRKVLCLITKVAISFLRGIQLSEPAALLLTAPPPESEMRDQMDGN